GVRQTRDDRLGAWSSRRDLDTDHAHKAGQPLGRTTLMTMEVDDVGKSLDERTRCGSVDIEATAEQVRAGTTSTVIQPAGHRPVVAEDPPQPAHWTLRRVSHCVGITAGQDYKVAREQPVLLRPAVDFQPGGPGAQQVERRILSGRDPEAPGS